MATRVSQVVVEALATGSPNVRASQVVVEAIAASSSVPTVRCSQVVIEALTQNSIIPFPPFYPILPGLTFSVSWAPQFYNMPTATSAAGADVDLPLTSYPTHTFTLSYNFLRDSYVRDIYWRNEFKKFAGFFNQLRGNNGRFLFKNPDDYFVVRQTVGTTDGINSEFGPVPRTYAGSTEPVGWVDKTNVINVYLDNVMVNPSRYFILQTLLWNQLIKFYDTPPA